MVHVVEGKTHPGHKNNVGADGSYTRQPTVFRNVIQPGGEFEPESGRYRLYVSAACGWSHRVMLMRAVMKLEEVIPMTIVHPKRHDDQGWHFQQDVNPDGTLVEGADPRFPECGPDPELGATYLHQIYTTADPNYTGNVTVPVLFDTKTKRIVSNESEVIMRNLNEAFRGLSIAQPSMYPAELQSQIDETNDLVYAGLSNGVCELASLTLFPSTPTLIDNLPSMQIGLGSQKLKNCTKLSARKCSILWTCSRKGSILRGTCAGQLYLRLTFDCS